MARAMRLRLGHRRLASVTEHLAKYSRSAVEIELIWRDSTSVEVALTGAAADGTGAAVATLAAALRRAHAEGAEYALALVSPDDVAAIRCLLRVGFEPELTGPGEEIAWKVLLDEESGPTGLL